MPGHIAGRITGSSKIDVVASFLNLGVIQGINAVFLQTQKVNADVGISMQLTDPNTPLAEMIETEGVKGVGWANDGVAD